MPPRHHYTCVVNHFLFINFCIVNYVYTVNDEFDRENIIKNYGLIAWINYKRESNVKIRIHGSVIKFGNVQTNFLQCNIDLPNLAMAKIN